MEVTAAQRKPHTYLGLPVTAEQKAAFEAHRKRRKTTAAQVLDDALRTYFDSVGLEWPHNPNRATS